MQGEWVLVALGTGAACCRAELTKVVDQGKAGVEVCRAEGLSPVLPKRQELKRDFTPETSESELEAAWGFVLPSTAYLSGLFPSEAAPSFLK